MVSKTDTYIHKFNSENNKICLSKWMHDHPTALKVIQVASLIIGLAALSTIPWTLPLLGVWTISAIGTASGLAVLSSLISWVFINYITCKKHEITNHVFEKESKEKQYEGGRLYYRGNIPILELDDSQPEKAGYAHGRLLGAHIHELTQNFNRIIHSILRHPQADRLPTILAEIRKLLPDHLVEEMKGLAHGFNAWAKAAGISKIMTEDDVLLMHLIPDSKHFHPSEMEAKLKNNQSQRIGIVVSEGLSNVACTTILFKDIIKGMVFGRNMDWCPFGTGGEKSLVMVWKSKGVAVLGTPGLIGAITGWNQEGLCLAMNVCPGETSSVRGVPSALFNRMVLENSDSVADVDKFIKRVRPLGPYHLTVGDDEGNGECISFYQDVEEADHRRIAAAGKPLLVVNWRYPECKGGSFNSEERTELLERYFEGAAKEIEADSIDPERLVDNAMKLTPLVNSWITMHSLLFKPESGEVQLSWDNGYAAAMPHQTLQMGEVF